MSDIRKMQMGQLVDFVITYNERQKRAEASEQTGNKHRASQAEIDAFFG